MSPGSAGKRSPPFRSLPPVDRLLEHPTAAELLADHPREEILLAVRATLAELRRDIRRDWKDDGAATELPPDLHHRIQPTAILEAVARRLEARDRKHYRRVINTTGILLHTGLGRAVLAPEAVEAVAESLKGYTLVEVDAETGGRNRREAHLASMLCELTGAEAATVVNNNAAATLILLAALARGREVIISRGQLVEIGGSYRVPEIMAESGARLREVGTTNRTYIEDYRRAVSEDTGMLLQVHTSNYEISGFAHHTPLAQLVDLGREAGLPVVSDLGSGCLVDLSPFGFRREPLVSESIAAGADIVCFSGDKLLGGPQAGILLGSRGAIETIRRHSLFRALRVDKVTLVALEATLKIYRDTAGLAQRLPVLSMISQDEGSLRRRAESLRRRIERHCPGLRAKIVRTSSRAGSGSLPTQDLPTHAVALGSDTRSPDELAHALRTGTPPVFTRLKDDRVLLDLRTIQPGEESLLVEALRRADEGAAAPPGDS